MLSININQAFNRFNIGCKHDFSLQGITGVLGHSGSGKTSLLRIISGLSKQANGTISFQGKILQDSDKKFFVSAEKRHIGFVFQGSRLFPHINVLENLLFSYKRSATKRLQINEIIQLTQIEHLVEHHVDQLSAGQKQRVAIARALLSDPALLLLDEPLSALDNAARGKMIIMLRDIHQQLNLPMIYVSHSIIEIQQLADDVVVMEQGNIIQSGHVHQVINRLDEKVIDQYSNQTSLTLQVTDHLTEFGLTQLDFPKPNNGKFTLYSNLPYTSPNALLRCYILASDISVNLHPNQQSSMVNNLTGHIISIEHWSGNSIHSTNATKIKVKVFNTDFNVNITRYSAEKLNLKINQSICLQFKANSIKYY